MLSRRTVQLTAAGASLAAGIGYATPAAAAVRYDPRTKTGFAGAADVRKAFGWSDATLTARAGALTFSHDFWTRDTYSVSCGKGTFPVRHDREFGRYELADRVVREPRRDAPAGYERSRRTTGFRITGPYAGISGTSVPPAVGDPCPEPRGTTILRLRRVSTATGWSLSVSYGTTGRVLRTGR
ncbi:hypothetical protein [Pseudosporangium ferrugineum]|uniref:Uncharacterized protein n=1 Tax=Pseudosporangium ferrugineum TaxID=439699 RepID=A0A2T0SIB0_9ACTN|nr:hypothetical protein [Pseudosporangium ferrugineum]PRY33155.1 hypothetical protein CLV70_101317 [Pseudosporangium ferrugineum]